MSGTAEPVRPPKTDAEWARQQQRRTESLENPTSQRIGEWVLSTSTDGHLIASHVDGGSTVLARRPASGETDPDAIQDDTVPAVSVTRTANQTLGSGGSTVVWDGCRLEVGGNWTGGKASMDGVIAPADGVYFATASIHFRDGNAFFGVLIQVDSVTQLYARSSDSGGGSGPWLTATAMGHIRLIAGQRVSAVAFEASGSVIGSETISSTPVPSSMSLQLVQREG